MPSQQCRQYLGAARGGGSDQHHDRLARRRRRGGKGDRPRPVPADQDEGAVHRPVRSAATCSMRPKSPPRLARRSTTSPAPSPSARAAASSVRTLRPKPVISTSNRPSASRRTSGIAARVYAQRIQSVSGWPDPHQPCPRQGLGDTPGNTSRVVAASATQPGGRKLARDRLNRRYRRNQTLNGVAGGTRGGRKRAGDDRREASGSSCRHPPSSHPRAPHRHRRSI